MYSSLVLKPEDDETITYSKPRAIQKSEQEKTKPDILFCALCRKIQSTAWDLLLHLNEAHSKKLYIAIKMTKITDDSEIVVTSDSSEHSDEDIKTASNSQVPKFKNKESRECLICCMKFSTTKMLSIHMRAEHSNKAPFKCTLCRYSSHHSSNIYRHLRMHCRNSIVNLSCPMCEKPFQKLSSIEHHIPRCYRVCFSSATTFKSKVAKKRLPEIRFDCSMTEANCIKSSRKIQCKKCGKCFSDLINLKEHRCINYSRRLLFQCRKCFYSCSYRSALRLHVLVCHNRDKENPRSVHSAVPFIFNSAIRHHLRKYQWRGRKKRASSSKCELEQDQNQPPSKLPKENVAKRALYSPKDKAVTSIRCNVCSRTFKSKDMFDIHKQVHIGYKKYECSLCTFSTVQSSNMYRHMRSHRRVDRPHFPCPDCKKIFLVSSQLMRHYQTCPKATNSSISEHEQLATKNASILLVNKSMPARKSTQLKSSSSATRQYTCDLCPDRWFRCTAELIRHMNAHTNQRPYKCTNCSFTACTSSNLYKHIRSKHLLPNWRRTLPLNTP